MAITKLDSVLEAIQQGKTNDEIRDEIDGRLSDKRLDKLRQHPDIRGGTNVDEERVNDPESKKEEIDREVEKIFGPGLPATPHQTIDARVYGEFPDANRAENPAGHLRQTGAEYKGLLGYYVDDRAVTFWADGVEIDSDRLDQLLEEIKEIVRIHKEFAKV